MEDATKPPADDPPATRFKAFNALTEKLIQVPKTEIDEKEVEYKREQAKKSTRRGPKKSI